jgi:GTP-binding protein Era
MNNNKNKKFRSGFVSLIGRPNVGKSTLMNCLIGEKIAITSNKPQTTRNKIRSILTTDNFQVIFIDTPGIHTPKSKLGSFMVKSAETSLNEIDIILYLIEPFEKIKDSDLKIIEKLQKVKSNIFLIINKIDTVPKEDILKVIDSYRSKYNFNEIIPISAIKNINTEELLKNIEKYLPEGPRYFPKDMITDQPERQIVSEIIREKALFLLQEEIPHGIAVEITGMKNRKDKEIVDVDATIYCERDSHKGIIIGKQGSMLKRIGSKARYDIERLLGSPINLQIWVKVKKDWRDSDFLLKNFGYDLKKL